MTITLQHRYRSFGNHSPESREMNHPFQPEKVGFRPETHAVYESAVFIAAEHIAARAAHGAGKALVIIRIQHLPGIQTVCGAAHQSALRPLWNIGFHYVSLRIRHPGETLKPNQSFF